MCAVWVTMFFHYQPGHALYHTHDTFGHRSFTAAGPQVWNNLPSQVWQDISCGQSNGNWKHFCLRRTDIPAEHSWPCQLSTVWVHQQLPVTVEILHLEPSDASCPHSRHSLPERANTRPITSRCLHRWSHLPVRANVQKLILVQRCIIIMCQSDLVTITFRQVMTLVFCIAMMMTMMMPSIKFILHNGSTQT